MRDSKCNKFIMPDNKASLMQAIIEKRRRRLEGADNKKTMPEKTGRESFDLREKTEQPPGPREKERLAEMMTEKEAAGGAEAVGAPAAGSIIAAGQRAQALRARQKKIEEVLSGDMKEMYLRMDSAKQREFKAAGEETAREINGLLESAKVKVKKIIELIKNWLRIVPGINKFFLEQEAKIKADAIMKIKKDAKTE